MNEKNWGRLPVVTLVDDRMSCEFVYSVATQKK